MPLSSSDGGDGGRIDTTDHNGLRGVLSLWVVIFHCFYNLADNAVDLQGTSLMPMFYLLSGFSLTIGYYTKLLGKSPTEVKSSFSNQTSKYCNGESSANEDIKLSSTERSLLLPDSTNTTFVGDDTQQDSLQPQSASTMASSHKDITLAVPKPQTLSYGHFMFNRLIRVLPVYYVCMLLCLPTFYFGFTQTCDYHDTTETIETYITNIIPSTTWFLDYFGYAFDIPAWTVQTLIAMWLLFPSILRYYHDKSDKEILQWIIYCYWIQMVLCIGLTYFAMYVLELGTWHAICLGRYHPLSRIWCFIMGVLSGILCLRYRTQSSMPWFEDANWFFPIRSTSSLFNETYFRSDDFNSVMFNQTYVLLAVTFLVFVADTIDRLVLSDSGIGCRTWLQAIVPFAQMNVMIGMVRHKDPENSISVFLRSSWMQWLGEISMCIYLIHYPIMNFILWARYDFKSLIWPDDTNCTDLLNDTVEYTTCEDYYDALYWPWTAILYLPCLSIALGAVVYYCIEKPFHNMKLS